eukprot:6213644-Pleurochrysis_carterae.AAC.8
MYWLLTRRYVAGAVFPRYGSQTSLLLPPERATQTEGRPVRVVSMSTQETQADWNEELIARRWLKKNGYYFENSDVLVRTFFHHLMSCLRRPAGRADKGGSQQAAFSMELPSVQPQMSFLDQCEEHPQARNAVNNEGKIE